MIDSISTSTVQSSVLRATPQSPAALQAQAVAPASAHLPTMRIRVDNNLDRAIIEVRSSENGKVLRQYPSEAQIRAFARAESLRTERREDRAAEAAQTRQASRNVKKSAAPAPRAEAPQQGAPQQSIGNSGGKAASSSTASSTQSIEV